MNTALEFIRASLFNVAFYGFTALACVALTPALPFVKRDQALKILKWYVGVVYALEKFILRLDIEVRGLEHLPPDGAYIVAAKHQSPYETLKLHRIFDDPAIVLKKELLDIPIWGNFLARIDPIAIDRSQGKEAMRQVIDGAKRIKEQGRAIVIFPQGTRVWTYQTTKDKPYKMGVARIQEETGLTIVPMALNSGMFWPREGWMKRGGVCVFEFLPPIHATGRPAADVLKEVETVLEKASSRLREDAQKT